MYSTSEQRTQASGALLLSELHLSCIANNFLNIYPSKLVIILLESSSIGTFFKKLISLVSVL
jgi:hypothetical protein